MTSSREIDTLARTLWGEARGEGIAGMEAVAAVVMNRVHADLGDDGLPDWWGEGVEAVCRKPRQFSCWNPGDPNLGKLGRVRVGDDPLFAAALAIARRALAGELLDATAGATHYHAAWARPRWAEGQAPTATIGRHVFYRLT
jgi:N-acetylmuramoyl-L-alanine amidase